MRGHPVTLSFPSFILALEVAATGWPTYQSRPALEAPRIHGELHKRDIDIAQSSVAKCAERRRGSPLQRRKTFLRHRSPTLAAIELFDVPSTFGEQLRDAKLGTTG